MAKTTKATGAKELVRASLAERKAVLEKSTEAFQSMYEEMQTTLNSESTGLIRARYDQGLNVIKMIEEPDKTVYGTKSVAKMAYCIGEDRSYLQNCRRFAEVIEADEVDDIIESRTAGNNAVTWSHVTALFSIANRKDREDAVQHLLDNDLSCQKFREWVRDVYGESPKANNSGGRNGNRDMRPSTFEGFVENVTNDVTKLVNYADKVWLADDDDDERTLRALSAANTIDKKTIKKVEAAKSICQEGATRLLSLERELNLIIANATKSKPVQPTLDSSNTEDDEEAIETTNKRKGRKAATT